MKIIYKHRIKSEDKIDLGSIIKLLLKNRNIKNPEAFLKPLHPNEIKITDFGFKKELKRTIELLEKIKKENKMIVVYTDYDADGITGGAILWETLHLLGFKVMPYVPHRKLEGYGFSIKGIDNIKKLYNPALIISVDHGITAKEKVSYAKKIGIPIVVTDHHLKPEKLPTDAEAIFHIPALSGSGVSYFFSKALFEHFGNETIKQYDNLFRNFSCDYLAFASIGSIADLVPLLGPTRSVVKYGLEAFESSARVGLKHLFQQAAIDGKKITPYEVGFIIAPRINAVGRLEHAIDALRLLCTTNHEKAHLLASKVGDMNRNRQDLVVKAVEEAKKMLKKELPKIIILHNQNWHEGIIGLIASKLTEEFYRPTIILTGNEQFLKGSARSIPSFHITEFLRELKEHLIDVGGHKGAAGFTMQKGQFDDFVKSALKAGAEKIKDKDLERAIEVDLKIPLTKIDLLLVKELEKLEPFGMGNSKPTFYSEVEIVNINKFGKNQDHIRFLVGDSETGTNKQYQLPVEFISFGKAKEYANFQPGQKINMIYSLGINRWNGSEKLQGRIIHLLN